LFAIWRSGSSSAALDDADSDRLVALGLHGRDGAQAAQERDAAARHDAFLDRCLRRVHRVLDAGLLLLHLRLGGRADLDQRHAATSLASRSCSFSRS
jgi:hypothetical protein